MEPKRDTSKSGHYLNRTILIPWVDVVPKYRAHNKPTSWLLWFLTVGIHKMSSMNWGHIPYDGIIDCLFINRDIEHCERRRYVQPFGPTWDQRPSFLYALNQKIEQSLITKKMYKNKTWRWALLRTKIKFLSVWGPHCTNVAFSLLTQRPWVWFSELPKNYFYYAEIYQWCW